MVCLDMDVLKLHKLLHLDLVYLKCALCNFVFGTPSSLKRHFFMQHGIVHPPVDLEHSVLSIEERVALTERISAAMTSRNPDQVNVRWKTHCKLDKAKTNSLSIAGRFGGEFSFRYHRRSPGGR